MSKARRTRPTIRDVAAEAGVSKGGLLYHFPSKDALADAAARRMGVGAGAPMIHVRAVHYGDASPFQYEDRWINPGALPGMDRVDFRHVNANEWLVRNFPWSRGDMIFSAENADARDARLLGTRQGTALLILASGAFGWGLTGIWVGQLGQVLVRLVGVVLRFRSMRWAVTDVDGKQGA